MCWIWNCHFDTKFSLLSPSHTGSVDFVGQLSDGTYCLMDWKRAKNLQEQMGDKFGKMGMWVVIVNCVMCMLWVCYVHVMCILYVCYVCYVYVMCMYTYIICVCYVYGVCYVYCVLCMLCYVMLWYVVVLCVCSFFELDNGVVMFWIFFGDWSLTFLFIVNLLIT